MMQEKAKNVVRAARGVVAAVALLAAGGAAEAAPALPDVVVENARMRLVLGGDARAKSLVVMENFKKAVDARIAQGEEKSAAILEVLKATPLPRLSRSRKSRTLSSKPVLATESRLASL